MWYIFGPIILGMVIALLSMTLAAYSFRCKHDHISKLYGDAILLSTRAWRRPTWARYQCHDCYRFIYKHIPKHRNSGRPTICAERRFKR